jgi:hypothetical protein
LNYETLDAEDIRWSLELPFFQRPIYSLNKHWLPAD